MPELLGVCREALGGLINPSSLPALDPSLSNLGSVSASGAGGSASGAPITATESQNYHRLVGDAHPLHSLNLGKRLAVKLMQLPALPSSFIPTSNPLHYAINEHVEAEMRAAGARADPTLSPNVIVAPVRNDQQLVDENAPGEERKNFGPDKNNL